jgi:hypothetical protein
MADNIFKSNSVLDQLNVLVGDWEMEASKDAVPLARAKTNFSWYENHAFMIYHSEAEPPLNTTPKIWIDNNPNPIVAVIGLDDFSRLFYYVYTDIRGVRRVYQMSLEDGLWKFWGRAAQSFYQRFEAKFNADNNIITGKIESSEDGKFWELDFDVSYTRFQE